MIGCESGEVTSDNLKLLELLEDRLSYPPRFRLQFHKITTDDTRCQTVTIKFNGLHPSIASTITLDKTGMCYYNS